MQLSLAMPIREHNGRLCHGLLDYLCKSGVKKSPFYRVKESNLYAFQPKNVFCHSGGTHLDITF